MKCYVAVVLAKFSTLSLWKFQEQGTQQNQNQKECLFI